MMQNNRVCVCIGCDQYQSTNIDDLKGCVKDAEKIFQLLIDENVGQNSAVRSKIVRNPTSSDVRSAFGEIASGPYIDTLTIFFAGHGTVRDGSYFLATRDTSLNRLSMTSLPVAELLMFVKEIKPRQVNILIDACEGAGVVNDLGTIIKGGVLGAHGSMGVSVLVSSASDRNANEDGDGGLVTSLVVKVLDGTIANHSKKPFLSLAEVGNLVWETGSMALSQQPSIWALNIFGETALCKNPVGFKSEGAKSAYVIRGFDVTEFAPIGRVSDLIEPVAQMFLDLPRRFDSIAYRALFQKISNALDSDGARVEVALGLGDSLRDRSRDGIDPFLPAKISAAVLASLLPTLTRPNDFDDQLTMMCKWFIEDVDAAVSAVAKSAKNKFWLLSKYGGGMIDLYLIPIRISFILGYIGSAKLLSQILGLDKPFSDQEIEIFGSVTQNYIMNLACVNDVQAAYLLPFFLSCDDDLNVQVFYETIRGALYNDIFRGKGFVADYDLPPDQIVSYLIAKNDHDDKNFEYVARPSALLTLMIFEFIRKGDADIIRYDIHNFDHMCLNWYIPNKQMDYALNDIEGGRNLSAIVGHSLFTAADIRNYWSSEVSHFILQSEGVESRWGQIVGLLAGLMYGDRVPWFLILDHTDH